MAFSTACRTLASSTTSRRSTTTRSRFVSSVSRSGERIVATTFHPFS
jgi:hypothetical protein